ncbi:CubicO group peptidase (beta-lactamase class C family) [Chryseobacterium bernardetii]|uniref:CubicO group peptidase (Beta-lactamase class C family) n=2 Tax=Chryseobacterium TaxID=59732 RepID=A0A543EMW6_9FLAO|nr:MULTISPECIES: serine hydrolase domain-containing protein [Chryseobacterium]MDR6369317.1 CubicO group peptidase (beta-lactamase class C family) [Chryseobacterium vietnamense]MDR6439761.1 CubicO group peptidase (beta-lactamase class C family) [Chryseobacterium bernardetii]TQM22917.1 CubicO group peptidase (beta-lactamase class C family) [Chryseobacterium aquifrigidense]
MITKKLITIIVLLPFFSYRMDAQINTKGYEKKIDSIIHTEFGNKNEPGGVFLITQNGKNLYRKAFGKANLELDVNMTPENVFQIGSMTKQFTAVAILILELRGKLNVTDPVSKYIRDYPNGNNITMHHLLTHTSGIKDFTKMKSIASIAQKEMKPEEMVNFFKNEPVDFAPGEKFDYNNSGYVVLGYIIELVSGTSYEDFIKKNIFDKAGMNHSYYASDRKVIPQRAYGYHKKEQGFVNKTIISFSVPFSSGSLMSTADDMLKWQQALNQNLLLDLKETQKALQKYKLNNGEEFTYGYGWHLKDINGVPDREHGGSVFGFKSMGVYIPAEDIYVIGLSNCDCHSPTEVTRNIAKATLNEIRTSAKKP